MCVALALAWLPTSGLAAPPRGADLVFRNGFERPLDQPPNRAEASRFLAQATFGASEADIDTLVAIGYGAWLDAQASRQPAYVLPYMRAAEGTTDPLRPLPFHLYRQAWFVNVLGAQDQLRQRVAFALSEIFVVSERGNGLANDGLALGAYHDILVRNAFGSYRQLLEDVTLSPAMGRYLSMYRNRKSDPAQNIRADENYAREVMQLFTIGLVELHPDGSVRLVGGQPVPTYDERVVRGFAQVFTGWGCDGFAFEETNRTCSTTRPSTRMGELACPHW